MNIPQHSLPNTVPLPAAPLAAGATRRWFMYRTRQGDLYFFDASANLTQWERPAGFEGKFAVNDRESWRAYRDSGGHVYYHNVQTDERTWVSAPECAGLTPVNDAESWLAVQSVGGEVYYHNIQTKETTWCKPPYLDAIDVVLQQPPVQQDGQDVGYQAADGAEFVLPSDEEAEDSSEEEEEGEAVDAAELKRRQEEILEQARLARERKEQQLKAEEEQRIEQGFLTMLGEQKDLKAYSQWTTWLPKLSGDKRFHAVPVEDRVRLFNRHVRELAEQGVESDKDRVKQARKLAVELRETAYGTMLATQWEKPKTRHIIAALAGFEETGAEEASLRRRLSTLLKLLDEKLQKKALKPFLRSST